MKCPNCGEEVEQGNLFCPKCLEEIPWVPEFNTLETLQTKKEYTRKKRLQKAKKQVLKHHLPRRRRKIIILTILAICLAIGIAAGGIYVYYSNSHSYAYQFSQATKDMSVKDYDKALEHVDRAIELAPDRSDPQVLLAQILEGNDDREGALKVLETALTSFPNDLLVYQTIIPLYLDLDQPDQVKIILDKYADTRIKRHLSKYITADPVISEDTGTYDHTLMVDISGTCKEYYYTLDNSVPDRDSLKYSKSIPVGEGTTELKVIGYNDYGIPSDMIYRKYIVEVEAPDSPVILPEETSFKLDTSITIDVPEGCICYYSFDDVPTTSSAEYIGPVPMPEGIHTIYAFFVGASGKESAMSSKTYELVY